MRLLKSQIHTENIVEWWLPGAGKGEMGSVVNEHRVAILQDEKVLKMDGGDGCTALPTSSLAAAELCVSKYVPFYVFIILSLSFYGILK